MAEFAIKLVIGIWSLTSPLVCAAAFSDKGQELQNKCPRTCIVLVVLAFMALVRIACLGYECIFEFLPPDWGWGDYNKHGMVAIGSIFVLGLLIYVGVRHIELQAEKRHLQETIGELSSQLRQRWADDETD